jgi:acetyl esterase/lipase
MVPFSKCQCLVVNVEYRLYPEAELLEPFDDGVWVTEWVKNNAQLIGTYAAITAVKTLHSGV